MVNFFEVVKEKIENIKLDDSNPNEMSNIKFKGLKETIKKYGFLEPIIVNKDNVMVDGEHRFKALKELGEKEIPIHGMVVNNIGK